MSEQSPTPRTEYLSPKELAMLVGVSESSLKRWVDDGRLIAERTTGGHRRIPLYEAVRFIRGTAQAVLQPEVLGIAGLTRAAMDEVAGGRGEVALLAALSAGQEQLARGLIAAEFLSSRTMASVCDGPVSYAVNRMLESGERTGASVSRSMGVCAEAMRDVAMLLASPKEGAAVAVGGGSPAGADVIGRSAAVLAGEMVRTCLREIGVDGVWLGPDATLEAVAQAARSRRARIVWKVESCDAVRSNGHAHSIPSLDGAQLVCVEAPGLASGASGTSLMPRAHSMAELVSLVRATNDPRMQTSTLWRSRSSAAV